MYPDIQPGPDVDVARRYVRITGARQGFVEVIPLQNSYDLLQAIPNAQLHVFGKCGHWTQIEHATRFSRLVGDFLAEG